MLCILNEHKCQYGRSDEEGADWLFLQEVHDSNPFGHYSQIITTTQHRVPPLHGLHMVYKPAHP